MDRALCVEDHSDAVPLQRRQLKEEKAHLCVGVRCLDTLCDKR